MNLILKWMRFKQFEGMREKSIKKLWWKNLLAEVDQLYQMEELLELP